MNIKPDLTKQVLPNHKAKPYGGAWPIRDAEYMEFIRQTIVEKNTRLSQDDPEQFVEHYRSWFAMTHDIDGLDDMTAQVSQGTTETFDKFYLATNHLRLRLFRGEYFYHQMAARMIYKDRQWLDEGDVRTGDVVIFSCPFADTGNVPDMEELLSQCDRLGVPVLIDMAYVNLATGLSLNLNHDCIKVVTTSMSKVFPVPEFRIGLRLIRDTDDDLLISYQQNKYTNRFACGLGTELMNRYPASETHDRYYRKQLKMCNDLDLEPSRCVIFGIDTKHRWDEYSRGGGTNRLCFSKQFPGVIS